MAIIITVVMMNDNDNYKSNTHTSNNNTSENNKIYNNIDCFLFSETIVNNGL